jgi:hypothetical protein
MGRVTVRTDRPPGNETALYRARQAVHQNLFCTIKEMGIFEIISTTSDKNRNDTFEEKHDEGTLHIYDAK